MKTVIIIQARMNSSRLPGKILKEVLGKPLLEYQLDRVRQVTSCDNVLVATTINASDDNIVNLCNHLGVPFFRGSELDVLSRYYDAAKAFQADVVVRLTADCPVIDPAVINFVISYYLKHRDILDYASNCLVRSYPRGMDVEIFSFTVLEEASLEALGQVEREHVTPFIYLHPQRYRLANISYSEDQSRHRWTVDTPEDFELIAKIIENLYPTNPEFDLEDILAFIDLHPELALINAHIEQNKINVPEKS